MFKKGERVLVYAYLQINGMSQEVDDSSTAIQQVVKKGGSDCHAIINHMTVTEHIIAPFFRQGTLLSQPTYKDQDVRWNGCGVWLVSLDPTGSNNDTKVVLVTETNMQKSPVTLGDTLQPGSAVYLEKFWKHNDPTAWGGTQFTAALSDFYDTYEYPTVNDEEVQLIKSSHVEPFSIEEPIGDYHFVFLGWVRNPDDPDFNLVVWEEDGKYWRIGIFIWQQLDGAEVVYAPESWINCILLNNGWVDYNRNGL